MEVKQAGVQESSSGSSQGQDIGNNASESVMVCNILVEVIHFYYFPQVGSSDSAITDTSCMVVLCLVLRPSPMLLRRLSASRPEESEEE